MSSEELERYEAEMELQIYKEFRDVVGLFRYVVETDQRFYLANAVDVKAHTDPGGQTYFEVLLTDAWAWDKQRPTRFVKSVRVMTFSDVNVEELARNELPDTLE